jgi:hypothetical protein
MHCPIYIRMSSNLCRICVRRRAPATSVLINWGRSGTSGEFTELCLERVVWSIDVCFHHCHGGAWVDEHCHAIDTALQFWTLTPCHRITNTRPRPGNLLYRSRVRAGDAWGRRGLMSLVAWGPGTARVKGPSMVRRGCIANLKLYKFIRAIC